MIVCDHISMKIYGYFKEFVKMQSKSRFMSGSESFTSKSLVLNLEIYFVHWI